MVLLSCALAVDAAAAAAGIGATERGLRPVLVGAALFGLFQSGMSALGCIGGIGIATWAAAWDHWVAFLLLSGIGCRTAWAGWSTPGDAPSVSRGFLALVAVAVATSLDALAAGLTLPLLPVRAWVSIVTIGAVTAGLSLAGGWMGRSLGDRFGSRLEIGGGLVLVALGVKILVEHLSGGT